MLWFVWFQFICLSLSKSIIHGSTTLWLLWSAFCYIYAYRYLQDLVLDSPNGNKRYKRFLKGQKRICIKYKRSECSTLQKTDDTVLHWPRQLLLLESFLADQCVNLIYKEQEVLNLAIYKGWYKMTAEKLWAHPQKPILCHSAALICAKTDADLHTSFTF